MDVLLTHHILLAVCIGFVVDCIVGDPEKLPHPVRWMGALITVLERRLRRETDAPRKQQAKGALLVLCVCLVTAALSALAVWAAFRLHVLAGIAVESLMCTWCLAARNLCDASMAVFRALRNGDIPAARTAVSMIVGRDTAMLDAAGITRAAVETVAENANDGVVAPLFFLLLGGPVCGMVYKAVNTMDSMIAYKNRTYRYFGTAAARSDDAAGFIPARLCALAMIAAAFLLHFDGRNAWKIFRRDRYKHESPNSAQTESACAGALRVQLAGDSVYKGIVEHKPLLGDALRPVEAQDIVRANVLMYGAVLLCLGSFAAIRFCLTVCL